MELREAIRRRRMVRSFRPDLLDPGLVRELLEDSLTAPSAGNTRGVAWVLLEGPETATYWERATTEDWRRDSARFPGLSRAPVVALSLCSPAEYVARYGEADKAASGLGAGGEAAWPVPYWFGDAAFTVQLLLLGATAAELGAAFLGNFRREDALLEALAVPVGWRLFGAVVLGRPDDEDRRSASLERPTSPGAGVVHWSRW
ncbi:MAG: nitroreductase family protein [Acidimicrobiales bacterium]